MGWGSWEHLGWIQGGVWEGVLFGVCRDRIGWDRGERWRECEHSCIDVLLMNAILNFGLISCGFWL